MPPVPKKKHTKARSAKRKKTVSAVLNKLAPCPSCKRLRPMHTVCPYCGYYKA